MVSEGLTQGLALLLPGLVVRKASWKKRLLPSWKTGSGGVTERARVIHLPNIPSERTSPSKVLTLLNSPLRFESFKWMEQSPRDLIGSANALSDTPEACFTDLLGVSKASRD